MPHVTARDKRTGFLPRYGQTGSVCTKSQSGGYRCISVAELLSRAVADSFHGCVVADSPAPARPASSWQVGAGIDDQMAVTGLIGHAHSLPRPERGTRKPTERSGLTTASERDVGATAIKA